jgi:uncharacterized membrane protein YozB (DUF420 family)
VAPLIPGQANAVAQIVILILLLASIVMKQRRKYFLHAIMMLAALSLNLLSLILVMFPSLLKMAIMTDQPLHIISIIALIHSSLGFVVTVLGWWLVASWHLQSSLKNCFKNKRLMRITMILWLTVLTIGFVFYYFLYLSP